MSTNATPLGEIAADVAARFWAKVNRGGESECWPWAAYAQRGYGRFMLNSKRRKVAAAHRVAFVLAYGDPPQGSVIDHTCFQPLCCNPAHLRAITQKQNAEHLRGARADSSSGIRGVTLNKQTGRWRATLSHQGRRIHLGYFDTAMEAGMAAKAGRARYYTHDDYKGTP